MKKVVSGIIMTLSTVVLVCAAVIITFVWQHTIDNGSVIWQGSVAVIALYLVLLISIVILILAFCIIGNKKGLERGIKLIKWIRNLFIGMSVVLLGIVPPVYLIATDGAPGVAVFAIGVVLVPLVFVAMIELVLIASQNNSKE